MPIVPHEPKRKTPDEPTRLPAFSSPANVLHDLSKRARQFAGSEMHNRTSANSTSFARQIGKLSTTTTDVQDELQRMTNEIGADGADDDNSLMFKAAKTTAELLDTDEKLSHQCDELDREIAKLSAEIDELRSTKQLVAIAERNRQWQIHSKRLSKLIFHYKGRVSVSMQIRRKMKEDFELFVQEKKLQVIVVQSMDRESLVVRNSIAQRIDGMIACRSEINEIKAHFAIERETTSKQFMQFELDWNCLMLFEKSNPALHHLEVFDDIRLLHEAFTRTQNSKMHGLERAKVEAQMDLEGTRVQISYHQRRINELTSLLSLIHEKTGVVQHSNLCETFNTAHDRHLEMLFEIEMLIDTRTKLEDEVGIEAVEAEVAKNQMSAPSEAGHSLSMQIAAIESHNEALLINHSFSKCELDDIREALAVEAERRGYADNLNISVEEGLSALHEMIYKTLAMQGVIFDEPQSCLVGEQFNVFTEPIEGGADFQILPTPRKCPDNEQSAQIFFDAASVTRKFIHMILDKFTDHPIVPEHVEAPVQESTPTPRHLKGVASRIIPKGGAHRVSLSIIGAQASQRRSTTENVVLPTTKAERLAKIMSSLSEKDDDALKRLSRRLSATPTLMEVPTSAFVEQLAKTHRRLSGTKSEPAIVAPGQNPFAALIESPATGGGHHTSASMANLTWGSVAKIFGSENTTSRGGLSRSSSVISEPDLSESMNGWVRRSSNQG